MDTLLELCESAVGAGLRSVDELRDYPWRSTWRMMTAAVLREEANLAARWEYVTEGGADVPNLLIACLAHEIHGRSAEAHARWLAESLAEGAMERAMDVISDCLQAVWEGRQAKVSSRIEALLDAARG